MKKFKVGQVVMERWDKESSWLAGQITSICGRDYYFTDGRVRRVKQIRALNRKELGH